MKKRIARNLLNLAKEIIIEKKSTSLLDHRDKNLFASDNVEKAFKIAIDYAEQYLKNGKLPNSIIKDADKNHNFVDKALIAYYNTEDKDDDIFKALQMAEFITNEVRLEYGDIREQDIREMRSYKKMFEDGLRKYKMG